MLLRLAYLTAMNAFSALRLLPLGERDKDVEILAPRRQITVLERQLGADRANFAPEDRAFPAALLAPLPRQALRRLRLLVRPDTVLRWHRDLMKQRRARTCRPKRPGRLAAGHPFAAVGVLILVEDAAASVSSAYVEVGDSFHCDRCRDSSSGCGLHHGLVGSLADAGTEDERQPGGGWRPRPCPRPRRS